MRLPAKQPPIRVWAILVKPMTPSQPDDLLIRLRSPDWREREAAAIALGDLPEVDALDALAFALRDPDTAVVDAAARALLKRGDTRALEPLLRALVLEEGEGEQVQSVMGDFEDSWLVDACMNATIHARDPLIRELAAEVLGHPLAAKRSVDVLRQALQDESPDVRESARDALARIERYGR
jgi:hypothetical protein